jgi:hypothetical protein
VLPAQQTTGFGGDGAWCERRVQDVDVDRDVDRTATDASEDLLDQPADTKGIHLERRHDPVPRDAGDR